MIDPPGLQPGGGMAARPGEGIGPRPVIAALVGDLFFRVPIENAVRAAGAEPDIVESPEALARAIERWPALVLIDLAVAADWQPVVRRSKLLPQTRSIPIVAFGSHMAPGILAAARAAGCDQAWARSRFVTELPALLRRTLHPPVREMPECGDPPPDGLQAGIEQFNRGEYWQCHETLETLWRAEPGPVRDLYQGVLQIGVAFHHLRAGNYAGAVKMLRRGLPRLRDLPAVCRGVPVAALVTEAEAIHARLLELGPERAGEFDLGALPKITLITTPVS